MKKLYIWLKLLYYFRFKKYPILVRVCAGKKHGIYFFKTHTCRKPIIYPSISLPGAIFVSK